MADANSSSVSGAYKARPITMTDRLDAVVRSLDALHYLNQLLDIALNADGGGLADPRSGLAELMGRQLEDIGDQVEAIRAPRTGATVRAEYDIERISARSRVHQDEVARVIFVLTGEDHQGGAYRPWDGNLIEGLPAHLLSSHIWNTLAHGDVWGQVSTATGVDLLDLKRILEAMLHYLPRREAIELQGSEPNAEGEVRAERTAPRDRLSGVDFGQIARETNLKEETVRRVVERLLAEPRPDPDAGGNAAVSNG